MGYVYITQYDVGRNFFKAKKKQGIVDLKIVTQKDFPLIPEAKEKLIIENQIKNKLNNFDVVNDYLLLSGSMINISLCVSFLLRLHQKINVLKYERIIDDYVAVEINAI
jgi:hypothetical protein